MPEYFEENLEGKHVGEEIHPGEAVEEKYHSRNALASGYPSTPSTRTPISTLLPTG